jgi:hypothetical protein
MMATKTMEHIASYGRFAESPILRIRVLCRLIEILGQPTLDHNDPHDKASKEWDAYWPGVILLPDYVSIDEESLRIEAPGLKQQVIGYCVVANIPYAIE